MMKTPPNPKYVSTKRAESGQLRYEARPALLFLYAAGATLHECAAAANACPNWVWRALKSAGIPLRHQGQQESRMAATNPQ